MKNINRSPLVLSLLMLLACMACDDVVFVPIQGSIQGLVKDNNGQPLAGIQLSATFEAPSQGGESFPETQTATTDANGFYRFSELWDEVTFSVEQAGFRPITQWIDLGDDKNLELNIVLEGSPEILGLNLVKTTLTAATPDTLEVGIQVLDSFNSNSGEYTGSIIIQDADGATQAIVPANMIGASQQQFLLNAQLTSDLVPMGTYTLIVEVSDPDQNSYQLDSGQQISVQ
ncbi:MAG: carboxypeptidase-like regulatory domain-containing protein [Saprospiraceae bacterium]|nr:carboxypeptidase-like regulatory domain-containing protein [Saprospiraceae bacterium]